MTILAHSRHTVRRFYDEVLNGGDRAAVGALFTENYIPHVPEHRTMPKLPTGRIALERRLANAGRLPNTAHRMVADGDFVFAQVLYRTAAPVNGADIFRLNADGKIVEHWNLRQALASESEADIAHRFAGPGDPDASQSAERNRERAYALYRDVWSKGDAKLALAFYEKSYIQHNPHIPSGADRIAGIIANNIRAYMEVHGTDYPIHIRHLGAQGDLVYAHQDIFMAGLGRNDGDRSSVMDIFRIDANGQFAEHWDVCHMESDGLPDHSTLF
jgi:predicted SnoaL-like aldol condensation-catalyzing enzyme